LFLLGFPELEEVSGVTRGEFGSREEYAYLDMWGSDSGPSEFDVDDSASAFVRCAQDQTISLEVAWATNRPENHEFIVRGTDAAARFDLLEGDLSFHSASSVGPNHLEDTTIEVHQNDTHRDEQRAFFDAIGTEVGDQNSVEEALVVQKTVDAIYRSSEQGRTVTVSNDS
jgi:predicted dehydrogenase